MQNGECFLFLDTDHRIKKLYFLKFVEKKTNSLIEFFSAIFVLNF